MNDEDSPLPWPHAPTHKLDGRGRYFVTAATLQHAHHFRSNDRLRLLHDALLRYAHKFGWQLEAWAVFSNHYHFVAQSPADASTLRSMIAQLHELTSKRVNSLDHTPQRQVWHNFWDVNLTNHYSYLARLNYTHENAVKHGLVKLAKDYPWCSASWFEHTVSAPMVNLLKGFSVIFVSSLGSCQYIAATMRR